MKIFSFLIFLPFNFRDHLYGKNLKAVEEKQQEDTTTQDNDEAKAENGRKDTKIKMWFRTVKVHLDSNAHCAQTLLYMIQMVISYLLMLIFMTFNVWLCIAVVLGATLGFYLFGWKKTALVETSDHCG